MLKAATPGSLSEQRPLAYSGRTAARLPPVRHHAATSTVATNSCIPLARSNAAARARIAAIPGGGPDAGRGLGHGSFAPARASFILPAPAQNYFVSRLTNNGNRGVPAAPWPPRSSAGERLPLSRRRERQQQQEPLEDQLQTAAGGGDEQPHHSPISSSTSAPAEGDAAVSNSSSSDASALDRRSSSPVPASASAPNASAVAAARLLRGALEAALLPRLEAMEGRIGGMEGRIVNTVEGRIVERMEEQEQRIVDAMEERVGAMKEQVIEAVAARLGKMEEQIAEAVADKAGDMEDKLAEAVAERMGDMEDQIVEAVAGRVGEMEEQIVEAVADKVGEMDDQIVEGIVDKVGEIDDQIVQAVADKVGELDDEIVEAVAEKVGEMEERFVEKMGEQEQRTKQAVQAMVEVRRGGVGSAKALEVHVCKQAALKDRGCPQSIPWMELSVCAVVSSPEPVVRCHVQVPISMQHWRPAGRASCLLHLTALPYTLPTDALLPTYA